MFFGMPLPDIEVLHRFVFIKLRDDEAKKTDSQNKPRYSRERIDGTPAGKISKTNYQDEYTTDEGQNKTDKAHSFH